MSDTEKQQRAARFKALRKALGFDSQEALADASPDGSIDRTYVVRAEGGGNQVSTIEAQRRFAAAMGIRVEDLADYLDGNLALDAVVASRGIGPRDIIGALSIGAFLKSAERLSLPNLLTRVGDLPNLREWLEANPDQYTVAQTTKVVAAYSQTHPRSRSDGQPFGGWGKYFEDVLSEELNRKLPGAVAEVERLELGQMTPEGRRRVRDASKKK